jgi:putative flippase GtrA
VSGTHGVRRQAARYVAVGIIGYGVQLGSFALFSLALDVPHVVAAVVAGILALASNFCLNRAWTFQAAGTDLGRHIAIYVVVCAALFAAQILVLVLLIGVGVPKLPAEAFSVVAVVPVNFVAQRRLVFRG